MCKGLVDDEHVVNEGVGELEVLAMKQALSCASSYAEKWKLLHYICNRFAGSM